MRIVISSSDLPEHRFARNWIGLGLAPGAVSRWTIPRGVLLSRWAPPGARRVEEAKVLSTSLNTAGNSGVTIASRLGITAGALVLELGRQDDSDEALRVQITEVSGSPLLADDQEEVVDIVIIWWRDDDGDLVDTLVDALTFLAAGGIIWVFTPKAGRPRHVEPSDIQEAAPTAGLSQTSSLAVAADWTGTRLVAPKSSRR